MDGDRTRRRRQITGTAAAIWALLAIGLSIFSLISPRPGPQLPVRTSIIAGVAVVHAMSDAAEAAGVEEGDQLLSVDGVPAIQSISEPALETGVVVQVPPFITPGDRVRIDTSSGEYLTRA